MVPASIKKIVRLKLFRDLAHVEIIPYNDSIWFIDREEKYWYLEYEKSGTLWYRFSFFPNFFLLFGLEAGEWQAILSEWVEDVLNCKVNTTPYPQVYLPLLVEDVLNCKVNTTKPWNMKNLGKVEDVLNCKVNTTSAMKMCQRNSVEDVLNCKVNTINRNPCNVGVVVEDVLNCDINAVKPRTSRHSISVGAALNHAINTVEPDVMLNPRFVEDVLSNTSKENT